MNDIVITYKTLQDESHVRLKIRYNCEYEVIPVPRQISITCGIAHRVPFTSFDDVKEVIRNLINDDIIENQNIHFYEDLGNNEYKQLHVI